MKLSNFAAYVKQAWKNKPDTSTPLSAERLRHIEDGIKGNSDAIEAIAAAVVNQIVNDPDKIASMAALYAVNQKVSALDGKVGDTAQLPDGATDVVTAIAKQNSDLSRNLQGWECAFPQIDAQSGTYIDIILSEPMSDSDYMVLMTLYKVGDYWSNISLSIANRTTTGFRIQAWNGGSYKSGAFSVLWIASRHRLV